MLDDKDFSVNVISKSGTTTEPAFAFRIFRKLLEEKYGVEEAKDRIFATTDAAKGALKKLATEEGFETFVIPDDIGGRYSVLTAVGLLPIAVSGADIDQMMQGAKVHKKISVIQSSLKIKLISMQLFGIFFIIKGKRLRCLSIMNLVCNISLNGGSNYLEKVKARMAKGFSRHPLTFQRSFFLGQYIQEGRRDLI